MATKKPGITLGELIDKLYFIRADRLALSNKADEMKKDEDALRTTILGMLDSAKLSGGKGDIAQASIKTTIVPSLSDFDDFIKYVFKNKAIDLLRRQVNATAVRERWDSGKEIPGVTPFTVRDINLSKK